MFSTSSQVELKGLGLHGRRKTNISQANNTGRVRKDDPGSSHRKFTRLRDCLSAKTNYFLLTSQCFSFPPRRTGSLLATTSKDKSMRIIDPRNGEVLREGDCHRGTKASKVRTERKEQRNNNSSVMSGCVHSA